MIRKRKILAYSLGATLGLLSTSGGANALCNSDNPAGTWHFFALQSETPAIKSTSATVRNSTNTGSTTIKVFPNSGQAFQNGTATAIKCVLTVAAGGNFTGPCNAFGVQPGDGGNVNVSGNLALSSCNLTGTVNVQGDPTPVTIQGGHVNGNSGAGIATQGTKQVLSFTLIKN